jgi:hypothetical protein
MRKERRVMQRLAAVKNGEAPPPADTFLFDTIGNQKTHKSKQMTDENNMGGEENDIFSKKKKKKKRIFVTFFYLIIPQACSFFFTMSCFTML